MSFFNELISRFAKVTKNDKSTNSETTVYGTIVESNGLKYVQIDGSEIYTPVASTTNVKDGERVTVMIKNHNAIVTGNISSPSARDEEVKDVDKKVDTKIEELEVGMLTAESADLKYANIDFANIGEAAMKYFYAESGLIENVTISEGMITGNLVGVTIKGDLIEGNTVVADKLVIKGEDGLYYKLNTDGMSVEAEQTEYNSLNGSIITANSITATKISVDDLVAFDATIGGFNITNSSIYSGVKSSINNTTTGIYMDKTGQIAFGDANSYIKYYYDSTDETYKLGIKASEMSFKSTSGTETSELNISADEIRITSVDGEDTASTIIDDYGLVATGAVNAHSLVSNNDTSLHGSTTIDGSSLDCCCKNVRIYGEGAAFIVETTTSYIEGDVHLEDANSLTLPQSATIGGHKLVYGPGEYYVLTSAMIVPGIISDDCTYVMFNINVGKPITADNIYFIQGGVWIHGVNGFLNNSRSGVTVDNEYLTWDWQMSSNSDGIVSITIMQPTAFTNATGASPVMITGSDEPLVILFTN